MTSSMLDQMNVFFGQMATALGQLMAHAKEWQLLLAGLLVVLAATILALGMVKAAKIGAATKRPMPQRQESADMRTATRLAAIATESAQNLRGDLEALRSLVRSALGALSSVDTNHETARILCTRIVALQGGYARPPFEASKRIQEIHGTFLHQFELLRDALGKDWSASEASAILIQLNACARSLASSLEQSQSSAPSNVGRATRT